MNETFDEYDETKDRRLIHPSLPSRLFIARVQNRSELYAGRSDDAPVWSVQATK